MNDKVDPADNSDALIRLREQSPKILNHYGKAAQTNKTLEELAELIFSICKWQTEVTKGEEANIEIYYNIQEEIADCLIMLYQIRAAYGFVEVDQKIHSKLDRTLLRIDYSKWQTS